MSSVRRTALVANVWVTAIVTLIAGMPQIHCRCADGSVKPFGLGFLSKASGCCCAEMGPSPNREPAAEPAAPGCPLCKGKSRPTPAASHVRDKLIPGGCTKLFVPPVPCTAAEDGPVVGPDQGSQPVTGPAAFEVPPTATAHPVTLVKRPDPLAPPGELLLLLQRFLI